MKVKVLKQPVTTDGNSATTTTCNPQEANILWLYLHLIPEVTKDAFFYLGAQIRVVIFHSHTELRFRRHLLHVPRAGLEPAT